MVKLFQRCPYKKLLLYKLFKNVPEQSGNNYDIIFYIYLFWKFPEVSQWFYLFPELLKASFGMEKKILGNLGLFSKLPWQYIFNF